MRLISSISYLQKYITGERRKKRTIGFVPTMGAMHEGHLSLIRKARSENDILVVSIFVNPAQFGPKEDYKKYPRTLKSDLRLCRGCGVDILFSPNARGMYPEEYSTYVTEEKLSRVMCGISRPGHFRGVATVVLKLFNIVQPDTAYFGQKDYQQALIIKRIVKDLNIPVKIKVMPVIRDRDGLALSSRNKYLSKKERENALILNRMLVRKKRFNKKGIKIEYFIKADKDTLKPVNKIKKGKTLIAVAAKIGKTRLIDNIIT